MEIIQNRYGSDRVIHKVNPTRLRIEGESLFTRTATDGGGNVTMFDFEGGPSLTVGGKVKFQNSFWKIKSLKPIDSDIENFAQCVIEVQMQY